MNKIVFSILMGFVFQITPVQAAEKSYTFGFVPQQVATVLVKKWGPILRYVHEKTGHKLSFRTAPTIPAFEAMLQKGEYDFSYMNPVHYTVFANDPGYRAFGKQKGKQIKGILVVRKDNPIKELSELDGKTLAFPAPAAFAASVLPRGSLSKKGVSFTPKYVGSHDSVYLGVVKGLYPAGGGIQRTFNTVKPKTSAELKVLWTTEGYTPHAFATHPRVPKAVVDAVQAAMADMFNDPAGKKLLQAVGFKQGFEAAKDADWAGVRALGFTELPK